METRTRDNPYAGMRAITISRLYGGGGGEVAARLAGRLEWNLIDHEVVARVAQRLGISHEEAQARDEQGEGLVDRLLHGMSLAYPNVNVELEALPPQVQTANYHAALRSVILAAADEGNAVIVGRTGQTLLADRRDVLRVLVVAPLEARTRYVVRREGLDEQAARRRIEQMDRARERYLYDQHHRHVTDPLLYDLTINTAILTLEHTVDLICLALQAKAARLGVSPEQLGPGAEAAPYPQPPASPNLPAPATDAGAPPRA